ncbi:MAG: ATP-dependent DNA helicase RecG, partial [Chitinophagales bacterium]|nr:ATP-dependent DNA helicase RecG [Chitinophagales bacterium]
TKDKLSSTAQMRINAMCRTNDGFVIAEQDLKLRGPGELEGTRQSGDIALKLADLAQDSDLVFAANKEAKNLLEQDPELELPENLMLRNYLLSLADQSPWAKIS